MPSVALLATEQPKQFGTFLTQRRHSCIAANYPSFDHLVGSGKERRRDRDAQCSGGLEVDGQFEFARLEMGSHSVSHL
jgi:hypothetical protein